MKRSMFIKVVTISSSSLLVIFFLLYRSGKLEKYLSSANGGSIKNVDIKLQKRDSSFEAIDTVPKNRKLDSIQQAEQYLLSSSKSLTVFKPTEIIKLKKDSSVGIKKVLFDTVSQKRKLDSIRERQQYLLPSSKSALIFMAEEKSKRNSIVRDSTKTNQKHE